MDKRLNKILDASGATPNEILSILFEEEDPYINTSTIGEVKLRPKLKMHCDECPLNKKCLSMFKIQPARKNQCLDLISSYIARKKYVLPIPRSIESKLVEMGFSPMDEYYDGLPLPKVIPKSYYAFQEEGLRIQLQPKASSWSIQITFENYYHYYYKNDFQLDQLLDVFKSAEKECIETMDKKIEHLKDDDQVPSRISDILKDGNGYLKRLREIEAKISKVESKWNCSKTKSE